MGKRWTAVQLDEFWDGQRKKEDGEIELKINNQEILNMYNTTPFK